MRIAISMVRNEEDAIESFVRHTLQLVDEIYITDHRSMDGTREILEALRSEGLPIRIFSYQREGHAQAKVMTDMMRRAFAAGADLVFPLDADEFLCAPSVAELVEALQALSSEGVYAMPYYDSRLEAGGEDGVFFFGGTFWRAHEAEPLPKLIIGRQAFEATGLTLAQGNHHALLGGGRALEPLPVQGLFLAHFPWRSEAQAQRKILVGWLSNVAQFTRYTNVAHQWGAPYQALKRGECAPMPEARASQLLHVPAEITAKPPRYSGLLERSSLNPCSLAEEFASELAEERFLQQRRKISLLFPFFGDLESFQLSFQSAISTDYPEKEYIVFSSSQGNIEDLEAYLQEESEELDIALILDDDIDALFDELAHSVTGDFVQWIMPGSSLRPDKLRAMGASLFQQETLDFLLADAATDMTRPDEAALVFQPGELYQTGEGDMILAALEGEGKTLPQGPEAALFRHSALAARGFIREAFRHGFAKRRFWQAALTGALFGAIHERFSYYAAASDTID